jgi:hypothetical protein
MHPEYDKRTKKLLDRLKQKLEKESSDAIQDAVKQIGVEASEQMVHNLSGVAVSWSGGTFRINVWTGNLRRHVRMLWPFAGDPYAVYVLNDAEYAAQIEGGISGEEKKRLALRNAKRSKTGRAYQAIPGRPGSLFPFWTMTEDSDIRDQEPRPFVEATAEQMKDRSVELLGRAFTELFVP